MIKKISLFAAILFVAIGLSSCKMNVDGNQASFVVDNVTHHGYEFDSLDDLKSSLNALQKEYYGQVTIGKGLEKDFDAQKGEAIKYTFKTPPAITGTDKPVICFKNAYWNKKSSNGMYETGYWTGGIRIYVYSDSEKKWSDPWDFNFGCEDR